MSTHNIRFYEDLTKIIFELSSNIIKYAPYFFCGDGFDMTLLFTGLYGLRHEKICFLHMRKHRCRSAGK